MIAAKARVDQDGLIDQIESKGIELADMILRRKGKITEFRALHGSVRSEALYNAPSDRFNISLGTIKSGTELPQHFHGEWQLVLVASGKIVCSSSGGTRIISPTEFCVLEPDEKHGFQAVEDSEVVLVSIPSDAAFMEEA